MGSLQAVNAKGTLEITYRDWRELLKRESDAIDSVHVTIPDHMHASVMLAALREGKHVYGQKPLTRTVAEAIQLLDRQMGAARFRGVRPMGATQGPLPPVAVLHALAERGLLFELMAHPHQLREAAEALAALVETSEPNRSSDSE